MPQTPAHITVDPLRYTLSVTLTPPTGTLVLARRNGSSTLDVVSMPVTVSAPTDFWLTDGGDVAVSMKLDNGQEVAADGAATQIVTVPASGGKAVRPSADALRAAGVVSSSDLSRLKARGAWAGTTVYAVNDTITANGVAWRCILAHTSGGSFSADPTKWERFGVGQVTSSAPGSPAADDLWYDKANDQWKRWSGSAWIPEGSGAYASPLAAISGVTYNALGQVTAYTATNPGGGVFAFTAITYSTGGLVTGYTLNGVAHTVTRDASLRVTAVS